MATMSSSTKKNLGIRSGSCSKGQRRSKRAAGGQMPVYLNQGGSPKIELEREIKVKNKKGRRPRITIDKEVRINGRGVKSQHYADAKAQYLATGGQARHGQSFNDWYRENHGFGDWVRGAWNTVKRGASSLWKNRDKIRDTAQNLLSKYDEYSPKGRDLVGGRGQRIFDYLDRGRQKVKHHTGYRSGGHALVPYGAYEPHGFGSFVKGLWGGVKKVFKPVTNAVHHVTGALSHVPVVGNVAKIVNKGTGAIKSIGGFKHGGMPVPYGAYEPHGFGDWVRGAWNTVKRGASSLWKNRDRLLSGGKQLLNKYDHYSPTLKELASGRGEKFLNLLDKGREKVRQHTGYAYGGAPGMSYNRGNRMRHDLGAYNRAAYENRMHPDQGFGTAMHHDIENYTHDAEEEGREGHRFGDLVKHLRGDGNRSRSKNPWNNPVTMARFRDGTCGAYDPKTNTPLKSGGQALLGADPSTWTPAYLQKKKFQPIY